MIWRFGTSQWRHKRQNCKILKSYNFVKRAWYLLQLDTWMQYRSIYKLAKVGQSSRSRSLWMWKRDFFPITSQQTETETSSLHHTAQIWLPTSRSCPKLAFDLDLASILKVKLNIAQRIPQFRLVIDLQPMLGRIWHYQWTSHVWFPICSQYNPKLYLAPLYDFSLNWHEDQVQGHRKKTDFDKFWPLAKCLSRLFICLSVSSLVSTIFTQTSWNFRRLFV